MIRCDYCNKEIRATTTTPYVMVQIAGTLRHYHMDPDRLNGDCAGAVDAALNTTTGNRPDKTTT